MSAKHPKMPPADVLFSGRRAGPPLVAPPTRKATFYLTDELIELIEDVRHAARKNGVRADKSRIVREALRVALHDSALPLVDRLREEER